MFLLVSEQLRILYARGSCKLFIKHKSILGFESVFLKCVCIWWLCYNPTDVLADNLQIEAHLKDGQVTGPPLCNQLYKEPGDKALVLMLT